MIKNVLLKEDSRDLRIVENLSQEKLPEALQQMLSLATTSEEQDILLMATLTAASACIPNLYFRYGPTGKRYYANLQCFILAAAASGKGIANQALDMIRVVDEQYPLLVSGDSTLAAWYKAMERHGGIGYMHESEGSVITDIWRTAAANYNTALRKAAEHEPISRNRCKEHSEIACPRLSMLLTGTFSQYRALVPNVENGYFSRLMTLIIKDLNPFNKRYVADRAEASVVPKQVGQKLLKLHKTLLASEAREWSLTEMQKERLGEHLEKEYGTLIDLLGENFHSVVVRMAVQIERIAMVLSALRWMEQGVKTTTIQDERLKSNNSEDIEGMNWMRDSKDYRIYSTDEDYETAEMIGNKLLMHMAAAFRLIEGEKQDAVPVIKPLDQRLVLFKQLPEEYASKVLITEAKAHGISQATAIRWNEKWMEEGLVEKARYGCYQKVD